jgi:hypothetical protein
VGRTIESFLQTSWKRRLKLGGLGGKPKRNGFTQKNAENNQGLGFPFRMGSEGYTITGRQRGGQAQEILTGNWATSPGRNGDHMKEEKIKTTPGCGLGRTAWEV